MRTNFLLLALASGCVAGAQPILKPCDLFPSMVICNIINAPVKELDVRKQNRKLLILNFWGTWCAPCLPEMDSLSKLQRRNGEKIRVIGISDETAGRLRKYLLRKPSSVWLASDSSANLYRQFAFNYVGQAAIISGQNRILALVRTDSINQDMIDRLLRGETLPSSAETGNKAETGTDPFPADSAQAFQVSLSGYRPGQPSMGKTYLNTPWEGRRRSYLNVCPGNMYQDAYGVSHKQVIYEVPEKMVCNWAEKSTLYCFDLLVKPGQKDSLRLIFQQMLNRLLPVKARLEKRVIPVYVLRRAPGAPDWQESHAAEGQSSFSGRGFEGRGIILAPFADYLANELGRPVIDETGLGGRYDITTENVLRTAEEVLAGLKKLGLTVEKADREMDVVIVYR